MLLRYLKSLIYNSVAELRILKKSCLILTSALWPGGVVAGVQIDLNRVFVVVRIESKSYLDGVMRGRIGGCFVVFLVFISEVYVLVSCASGGK